MSIKMALKKGKVMDLPDLEKYVKPEAEFRTFLTQGRFMIQRSSRSGDFFYPPRVLQPLTGAQDLEWVEISGNGTVYSTSVMRERPPKESYNLALIDLEEGPRMISRVEGIPPEDVKIGMSVKARIVEDDGSPLVVFYPA